MQLFSIPKRDLRTVLLDQAGERRWLDHVRGRLCFRGIPDDWNDAGAWLQRTLSLCEARTLCAEWIAVQLDIAAAGARDVSTPLRPVFAARLLAVTGNDSKPARLCAAVLNWTNTDGLDDLDRWVAWAAVAPPELLPAFVLDTKAGLHAAALSTGDQLALAGFPVALQATPEIWKRFLSEQPSWDRCATRWRAAEVFGTTDGDAGQTSGSRDTKTEQFLRANIPEAMALLDHARAVVPAKTSGDSADDQARSAARSAAEALLFAVLEARPLTRKKFRLNAPLDFSFGPRTAEGDLTAVQARLVVEIDGYHHFRDQAGYRRDRRKDELLQAHGWFVIRFLADDIVSDLEAVLHRIEERLARLEAARTPH